MTDPLGVINLSVARVRSVRQDGVIVWKVECPRCKTWGEVDADQWTGSVSCDCPTEGCGFHETINFKALLDAKMVESSEKDRRATTDRQGTDGEDS
jgi:hypothetical protein